MSSSDLDLAAERGYFVQYSTSPSRREMVMARNVPGSVAGTKSSPLPRPENVQMCTGKEGLNEQKKTVGHLFGFSVNELALTNCLETC